MRENFYLNKNGKIQNAVLKKLSVCKVDISHFGHSRVAIDSQQLMPVILGIYTVWPESAWLHSICWACHAYVPFLSRIKCVFLDVPGESETGINVVENESNNPSPDTFCWCKGPDEGDLIYCDGPDCSIGWFHFPCVGIYYAPAGKWLCPDCQSKSVPELRDQTRKCSAYKDRALTHLN